jgi:hypothetical protein
MRRGLTIAAIALGVAGVGYSLLGIVMTATFTLSGIGVAIYFVLFVVSLLTAGAGVLRLRRIARATVIRQPPNKRLKLPTPVLNRFRSSYRRSLWIGRHPMRMTWLSTRA